jgi:hypothetical protein
VSAGSDRAALAPPVQVAGRALSLGTPESARDVLALSGGTPFDPRDDGGDDEIQTVAMGQATTSPQAISIIYFNHTDAKPAFNTKSPIVSMQNCPGLSAILLRHDKVFCAGSQF